MTDQQLYLAIGIPTVAVLVAMPINIGFFRALIGRIDRLAMRLGQS